MNVCFFFEMKTEEVWNNFGEDSIKFAKKFAKKNIINQIR